ncbi:MAG: GDP-mannose 4,6-dehydratase [Prolixibacteraceae bacterium]|jgi:GDPmannose 4,6-dehydratase|nr:GDP-mannose 4,6-dehydratase [Prolixibacteraceae bacterium]MBT7000525.1 GDP-mannose 4,6-dehydratase [Prolixibacteraceae bacterium]MBT7393473.1 GDP-mannose 4,6-dehydratase [Prolixibacteraceae bacterium]
MKKALITGVTGQDGSYLAEFLLDKGYEVHGLVRRSSLEQKLRIEHLYHDPHYNGKFKVHYGDMTDSSNIIRILDTVRPNEIYNLAAQSHVRVSFEIPEYTANADAIGPLRILEAIRILGLQNHSRFYQASTSELYGKVHEIPQKETTPFYPRSPYGVAKLYAYWLTRNYREAYNIYASNGILFNHESPRRGNSFVTKKIAIAAAQIAAGQREKLFLGNLNACRDWGYAPDYVRSMWMMLQHNEPDDFVVATGETRSVREFVEKSFLMAGVQIQWEGEAENEKGIDKKNGKIIIEVDPWYYRPTEVDLLVGDYTKAKEKLGWEPQYTFDDLIQIMMEFELNNIKK